MDEDGDLGGAGIGGQRFFRTPKPTRGIKESKPCSFSPGWVETCTVPGPVKSDISSRSTCTRPHSGVVDQRFKGSHQKDQDVQIV